ncbi:MAG: hypothetical protein LBT09_06065 [Planctomycetaceae bacterium]|nr:hypothetical protein [Planctomycetaceae bacterium]
MYNSVKFEPSKEMSGELKDVILTCCFEIITLAKIKLRRLLIIGTIIFNA